MNKESERILYKVIPEYTIKDYIELNKITYKDLYIVMRGCSIILLLLGILSINYISKLDMFIKVMINIILFIALWNSPSISVYKSKEIYVSPADHITLYFYENYFKAEHKSGENFTIRTTYYNKIEKIYTKKNNIIIKAKDPIGYTIIRKSNFIQGNVSDFTKFLNTIVNTTDFKNQGIEEEQQFSEDELKFTVSKKCEKKTVLEAYRIIARKKLLLSRIIMVCFVVLSILDGIKMKVKYDSTFTLIVAACIFVLFTYMGFNLDKLQLRSLNKKFNLNDNLPDKFSFYNSYYLFKKSDVNSSDLGKLNYDQIENVYISDNLFILKSKDMMCIIDKDGFVEGTSDEFLDFLQEKFEDKIKIS